MGKAWNLDILDTPKTAGQSCADKSVNLNISLTSDTSRNIYYVCVYLFFSFSTVYLYNNLRRREMKIIIKYTQTHTRPCLSVCVRSYSIAVFTQVCRDCMVCIRVYSLTTTTYRCMIVFETSAVKGGRKHACALKSWSLILTFKFFVLSYNTHTRVHVQRYT